MLGMIEINLLPQEYRVQERTPLGLLLTVVVGFLIVGGVVIYGLELKNQLTKATSENASLTTKKEAADKDVARLDALNAEIKNAQRRQTAIIDISQSKILWSQKLVQFGRILADYPDFWIDRLSLERGGARGNGTLSCTFYALGGDLRRLASFREKVKNDTNFWYHFDSFDANSDRKLLKGGPLAQYGYTGPVMQLTATMPVK
jgi:hypothetical protein